MGFLPIFLALSLFLMLWGIVVSQFLIGEKKKIQILTSDMEIDPSLDSVESVISKQSSEELRKLRAMMFRYNKLISSFPYKLIAGLIKARSF